MTDTQMGVSPAEMNEAGVPEILLNAQDVPEARAFYSSNPAFLDGASQRSPDEDAIGMAVISEDSKRSINGRDQEVLHALRFMRVHEGREEGEGFVIVDHSLAAKGLRWIRKNTKNGDIHKSAVQSQIDLDRSVEAQKKANINDNEGFSDPEPRISIRSQKREDEKRRKAELQAEHEATRQAEFELLAAWQEEHPPRGTNHFAQVMPKIKTIASSTGETIIVEDTGLKVKVAQLQDELIYNPDRIIDEIKDGEEMRAFLEEEGLSTLIQLFDHAGRESQNNWANLVHSNPEEFREIFGQWMNVLAGFSDEYKSLIRTELGKMRQPHDIYPEIVAEKGRTHPMAYEAGQQSYAEGFLVKSLVAIGNSEPEKFRDMIYDIVEASFEHEDRFVTETTLYLIAASLGYSESGNIVTLNTPIAKGLSETDKLKGVDLRLCLNDLGYRPRTGKHSNRAPKKLHRKYSDVEFAAATLGLNPRDKDFDDKMYELSSEPYIKAVKSGELPGSLYLKLKQQEADLPQDA